MRAFGLLAAAFVLVSLGGCSAGGGGRPDGGGGAAGSGTGGRREMGGSAGATGGGNAGTGGSAGTDGGAGTDGIMNTGTGGNPGSCPASAPPPGQSISCTADGTAICNYPGETCACRIVGAVNAWVCITCPASEPMNGSSCTPPTATNRGGINCPYGNDFCACRTDNAWYCRCNGCP